MSGVLGPDDTETTQVTATVGPADGGTGPGGAPPGTLSALVAWVQAGCPEPAPLRTGFNVVVRVGGSVVAAVGARTGYSLYWAVHDGALVISPRLPEVVSALGDRARLSTRALQTLGHGFAWGTAFEGVHRLTCGFRLVFERGRPAVHRWHRPEEVDPIPPGREVQTMRSALSDAIDALGQDHLGVAMSGGLDSTTLATLAHHGGAHIDAWYAQGDDRAEAEAVAAAIGIPLHVLDNGRLLFLDYAQEYADRNFAPLPAPANAWYLRGIEERSTSSGHRYHLSGRNGNAVFSMGPASLAGGWRRRLSRRLRGLPTTRVADFPDHLRKLPLRIRWSIHDPAADAHGGWTGGDSWWDDPFTDPEVRRASFAMPDDVWHDRGLARRVGVGLLPEQVRLRTTPGRQSPDLPRILVSRRQDVADAIDRVAASSSAARLLDVQELQRSIDLLGGEPRDAATWRKAHLRPLNAGLFAAWWDEYSRGRARASGTRAIP